MSHRHARNTDGCECWLAFAVLILASCADGAGVGAHSETVTTDTGTPQSAIARFLDNPGDPKNWRWLCKAAAEGNGAAQYTVGVRYRDGLPPVARNPRRAYRWFTAAVRSGLPAAAIARDDLVRSMPETEREALRKDRRVPSEADCADGG